MLARARGVQRLSASWPFAHLKDPALIILLIVKDLYVCCGVGVGDARDLSFFIFSIQMLRFMSRV